MHESNERGGQGSSQFPASGLLVYGAMVVASVVAVGAIGWWGEGLATVEGGSVVDAQRSHRTGMLLHVLLALAAVIVVGRLLGWVFAYVRQPPVIGEMLAGILLGPSLLGRVAPELGEYIFPELIAPSMWVLARVGVILYMFVVGLELDVGQLRGRGRATVAIAHASIALPFVLGACLALGLYSSLAEPGLPFTPFALFFGVSMAITAFPVLARILTDWRMHKTELGAIALTCAAIGDVTAWCLLAVAVGVAQTRMGDGLVVAFWSVVFVATMLFAVRPIAGSLARRFGERTLTQQGMSAVFVAVLASAFVAEWIHIHAIFGAFLLGAIIPHDSAIARQLGQKLEDLVTALLLPAFFAVVGMRTQIGLVSGWQEWAICALIIAVATVGKFGGTLAAARYVGMPWRDSAALGVLMNTRGLMELIVLNVGLDLGVISPTLFAMMVIMALVTTMATSPLLSWLVPSTRVAVQSPPRELESTISN